MVNRVEIHDASSSDRIAPPSGSITPCRAWRSQAHLGRCCCRTHDPTGSGEICIINNTPNIGRHLHFDSAVKFIPGIAKDANTVELIDELKSILKYCKSLFSSVA